MYSLLVRIMATLLATLFSIFNISADIPGFSDNKSVKAEIDFVNEEAGSADAVISLEATADGEYKFFWADESFEKLTVIFGDTELPYSEFASITTYFGLIYPITLQFPTMQRTYLLSPRASFLKSSPSPKKKQ